MAQEYELTAFEAGDFKDAHGNTWATAVFLGEGEPVKWVVKDPTAIKVGQKYYGSITEQKSKAGKTYLRFKRESVPEGTGSTQTDKPSEEYWADKQNQIKAQWAIGQAVSIYNRMDTEAAENVDFEQHVEDNAKVLFAMVDRVKNPQPSDDAEARSLAKSLDDGTPINMDDLPL